MKVNVRLVRRVVGSNYALYERNVYPFYRVPGTRTARYKRDEIHAIIEAGRVEVR